MVGYRIRSTVNGHKIYKTPLECWKAYKELYPRSWRVVAGGENASVSGPPATVSGPPATASSASTVVAGASASTAASIQKTFETPVDAAYFEA